MKYRTVRKRMLLSGCFLCIAFGAAAQVNGLIKEGNKSYSSKDYKGAEKAYGKALGTNPDSYGASFNMGDALYKLKKYKEATGYFDRSAGLTKDRGQAAKSYYNLGNSYMALGQTDEGIKAYKKALKMNPDDVYAKYNLSYAVKEKKAKAKRQQAQNQQRQKQQNNQADNNGNQNMQPQQNGNQQNNQDQSKNSGDMTQEEAERIMNAINNNEQGIRKRLYNSPKADQYKTDKPW